MSRSVRDVELAIPAIPHAGGLPKSANHELVTKRLLLEILFSDEPNSGGSIEQSHPATTARLTKMVDA